MSHPSIDHDDRAVPLKHAHSAQALRSRWVLHAGSSSIGHASVSLPASVAPSMPHINGWLELQEETLLESTLRVAGLVGSARPTLENPDAREHLRFQGDVTSILPDGLLRLEGQVRAGSRLAPAVGELGLGRYLAREGSEVLALRFQLIECALFSGPGIEAHLTAVRLRPAS